MKEYIVKLSQVIRKENGEEISEIELDAFIDDYLELCEQHGFMSGGGFEYIEGEDVNE